MKKSNNQIVLFIIITIVLILGIIVYNRMNNIPYRPITYIDTIKYEADNTTYENISKYDGKIITTYADYENFKKEYNINSNIKEKDFNKYYYIIVFAENDYCGGKTNGIRDVKTSNNKVEIDIGYDGSCGPCAPEYKLFIVPIEKEKITHSTTINYKYTVENKYECDPNVAYKPIIYLYPTKKTDVTVKLLKEENITTTYPKYNNKWSVTAYPNGNLIDKNTNRNLYGLYWEGINKYSKQLEEGFVIKGKDTASFLEKTLEKLGLNEREPNEFIIYWLPKLENNNYNYIHFSNKETINKIMPIEVKPKPDTIIRVLMEYKPLNKKIKVKNQKIETPIRKGFTVVEWGGTELKK